MNEICLCDITHRLFKSRFEAQWEAPRCHHLGSAVNMFISAVKSGTSLKWPFEELQFLALHIGFIILPCRLMFTFLLTHPSIFT